VILFLFVSDARTGPCAPSTVVAPVHRRSPFVLWRPHKLEVCSVTRTGNLDEGRVLNRGGTELVVLISTPNTRFES
jgi:hypothetical protein